MTAFIIFNTITFIVGLILMCWYTSYALKKNTNKSLWVHIKSRTWWQQLLMVIIFITLAIYVTWSIKYWWVAGVFFPLLAIYFVGLYFYVKHNDPIDGIFHEMIFQFPVLNILAILLCYTVTTIVMYEPIIEAGSCVRTGFIRNTTTDYTYIERECQQLTAQGSYVSVKLTRGVPTGRGDDKNDDSSHEVVDNQTLYE